MHRPLLPLPVGPTDHALASGLLGHVHRALEGTGPAIDLMGQPSATAPAPVPGAGGAPAEVPDEVALVVRTSGSTGLPRGVMLDAAALRASAEATHARLGGPGRWLLALPPAHVAGVQVLVRSAVAGLDPLVLPAGQGFDPDALAAVVRSAPGDAPLYTALVPTQLHRVLSAGAPTLDALSRLDAVLVGGAATPPALVEAAREHGLPLVLTYGMTETCGGCVYDGLPLDGVEVTVDQDGIRLAGPVLARGYLGRPDLDAAAFTTAAGRRWFRTRDLGLLDGGRLTVLGRSDDVLVTGGLKVAPAAVEAALAGVPGVGEVCVVGVPDTEWGQAVTAVVVPRPGSPAPELAALRRAARTLGVAAAPRHLVLVDALAQRGPGKVDRAEVAREAAAALARTPRTENHDDAG
ncbi:o-succinylbenzoate--CoA ligase [Actinotalea sp. BY-33]|uniref:O-succinylbenzoate--CoA ligase n=1 Tax=Actinotalea soli TaxID=2819234 RepID=A0A939RVI7_9CELL|nr:o-succinylbenzoate--CoA ligase [Actinotalea soli]MBO1752440.1 o-succinylbenzoate--CoA ligase [Actinotalea soli]